MTNVLTRDPIEEDPTTKIRLQGDSAHGHLRSRHTGIRHIGLIVAGSLITGSVVALVLVIGPFGGAQEHVIMGTALLGFALGWTFLAVFSMLLTDQPQRWTAVPAGLAALAGASLLIFAPDANAFNALGWVWPPLLFALAIWMAVQARRHLRSLTRRLMLYPLFGVLALAAVGGGYETIQEQVDRSLSGAPGQLIDVGGHRLYLNGFASTTAPARVGARPQRLPRTVSRSPLTSTRCWIARQSQAPTSWWVTPQVAST